MKLPFLRQGRTMGKVSSSTTYSCFEIIQAYNLLLIITLIKGAVYTFFTISIIFLNIFRWI